ncbi:MAG: hypothetical protein JSW71_05875 [Gemmatimonadota bacterium]|nr:MAG: hypothetical protein JSW71_05875 [Gemmatimonadota bacterium]
MDREVGHWRAALLAHEIAGRTLTAEQIAASIRWIDSLLRMRQDSLSRDDTYTVKYLDRGIQERCEDVDERSLNEAREHLERYDAAQSTDHG